MSTECWLARSEKYTQCAGVLNVVPEAASTARTSGSVGFKAVKHSISSSSLPTKRAKVAQSAAWQHVSRAASALTAAHCSTRDRDQAILVPRSFNSEAWIGTSITIDRSAAAGPQIAP